MILVKKHNFIDIHDAKPHLAVTFKTTEKLYNVQVNAKCRWVVNRAFLASCQKQKLKSIDS